MRRGLLILLTLLLVAVSGPSTAQVPTAEQLELLRSMSPEDRAALMDQLGIGSSVIDDAASSNSMSPVTPNANRDTTRDTRRPALTLSDNDRLAMMDKSLKG